MTAAANPTPVPGTPEIVERAPQLYLGVRELISMTTFGRVADRLSELFAAMAEQDAPPVGAPFLRYLTIDMPDLLDVEAGVPIARPVDVAGDHFLRTLPGGRFVSLLHRGHPDTLIEATAGLLAWAEEQGLTFDRRDDDFGDRWVARLETFLTNPADEPDLDRWETLLLFKLAD